MNTSLNYTNNINNSPELIGGISGSVVGIFVTLGIIYKLYLKYCVYFYIFFKKRDKKKKDTEDTKIEKKTSESDIIEEKKLNHTHEAKVSTHFRKKV